VQDISGGGCDPAVSKGSRYWSQSDGQSEQQPHKGGEGQHFSLMNRAVGFNIGEGTFQRAE